jgi:hypothetical protein
VVDLVGSGAQWELRKEAALSALVEQQKEKEAVEAENAANNAKLLENIAHVRNPQPQVVLLLLIAVVLAKRHGVSADKLHAGCQNNIATALCSPDPINHGLGAQYLYCLPPAITRAPRV